MGRTKIILSVIILGCGANGGNDAGANDAGAVDTSAVDAALSDTETNDADDADLDAPDAGGVFECDTPPTFFATDAPVTALTPAGAHLLVGHASGLDSRDMDLRLIDHEDSPVVNLSADGARVAVFDGSDARLFAIDDDGALNASGRFDVSGRSVLALRGLQLFTFRYPLEARINTVEARDIEDLASPLSLGQVSVDGTGPTDVQLAGSRAYALDFVEARLSVIDISDPSAMVVVGLLDIPGIVESSELAIGAGGVFVGRAGSLAHVDMDGSSITGSSEGGALVAVRGGLLATASPTQLFVYRLEGSAAEPVGVYDTQSAPAALAWTEDSLVVGGVEGLHVRRCGVR